MEELEQYLPPELSARYEALALLKETAGRQTLLLGDRNSGEKLILKRAADDMNRPEDEYRLLKELAGEGIPVGFRCFRTEEAAFLLREYIPGETLLDYIQKKGTLSVRETAEIGASLCRILTRLHSRVPPVIHRDVKAENIVRTPDGRLYLIDFDIARRYEEGTKQDTQVLGTPGSAPPEQFGYRQTDPRSDVYSVGCLLHTLSTGENSLNCGEAPALLRRIIRKCVSFDPDRRYPSAVSLERELRRVQNKKCRRLRYFIGAAGVLVLAAFAFFLFRGAGDIIESPYQFASPAIEAEVCRQLGKEPGTVTTEDLGAIKYILLCGEEPFQHWDQMMIHGAQIEIIDGVVGWGKVDTLEDIPNLPNLTELALCNQEIEDLSPLAGCELERLALHCNRISDLTPLAGNPALWELYISANPVSDLSPLAGSPMLWRLNVGATEIRDLSVLAELPALTSLECHDCPALANPPDLGTLTRLRFISLRPVSGETLAAINELTGLQHLYIWGTDATADLTPLDRLENLTTLYVDMDGLTSLEGAERLRNLEFLDIRGSGVTDLTPLAALPELRRLNVIGVDAVDWGVLARLPDLEQVICTAEQGVEIRKVLENNDSVSVLDG